jgi:hypothetical protein
MRGYVCFWRELGLDLEAKGFDAFLMSRVFSLCSNKDEIWLHAYANVQNLQFLQCLKPQSFWCKIAGLAVYVEEK